MEVSASLPAYINTSSLTQNLLTSLFVPFSELHLYPGGFFAERAALVQHRSASPSQGSTHPHLLHSHSTAQYSHSTGWQRSVMRKWNALGEGDPGGVKMVTASWETDLMSSRQLHNIKKKSLTFMHFLQMRQNENTRCRGQSSRWRYDGVL